MDVIKSQSRGARVGCHGIFISVSQKYTGFTLLEILIILSIVSIVSGFGLPSINNVLTANKISQQVNQLVGTLAYSRSEAIKRQQRITLCQSIDNIKCDKSGDWSHGWILFIDTNRNRVVDEDEKLLHENKPMSQLHINFNGSGGRDGYVVYKSDGSAFPNGSFIICHPGNKDAAKALIIKHNGRLRTSDKTSRGKTIECTTTA